MLVVSRKNRESVVVSGEDGIHRLLKVTVLEIGGGKVKLGFEVDDDVPVNRLETWELIRANGDWGSRCSKVGRVLHVTHSRHECCPKKDQTMTIHAGVWIDHHKAVVVLITDKGEEMLQFMSDRDTRSPGAARKESYTPNDFVAEDKLERKVTIHLNKYYDEVIACLSEADSILIIGPGEAKGEFQKRIQRKKLPGRMAPLQTVDKMTDRQIAAHVRQHFALAPGKKSRQT